MRFIDPTLTAALAAGTGIPFLKAYIGYQDGTAIWSGPAISYKLTGQSLEFEVAYQGDAGGGQTCIWLERGITNNQGTVTATTGFFFIDTQEYLPDGHQVAKGSLFPKQYYAAAGDVTYKTVIDALCSAFGKTAVYREPAAAWLGYKFFPAGKGIILNDPNYMRALLQQKYLIFFCDNGGNEILFYSCSALIAGTDLAIAGTNNYFRQQNNQKARLFLWRDETGSIHTDGLASNPIHNLGYLESTAACPVRHYPTDITELHSRPDLRLLDGDKISLTLPLGTSNIFALMEESYAPPDRTHSSPRWETVLKANGVFDNTAGGAMPSTMERVSNYTPLNTSTFNGILSTADNNLQAAETLDDHVHYALQAGAAAFAPADGATYYFGGIPSEPPQAATTQVSILSPQAGNIKAVSVRWAEWGGVAGSGEAITMNVRIATVSTLIATVANTAAVKTFPNYSLNIPVVNNQAITIEVVCPTWATNPTQVRLIAVIFIESPR